MSDIEKLRTKITRLATQADGCADAPLEGETASDVYRWVAQRLREVTWGQSQEGGNGG